MTPIQMMSPGHVGRMEANVQDSQPQTPVPVEKAGQWVMLLRVCVRRCVCSCASS